jgi:hypothetical protein
MNRIVLFRYHKKPLLCRSRLWLLKKFNPGIKIFGLYGGKESEFPKYQRYLGSFLEHNYCIKGRSNNWKWKNSDLAIRLWYKSIGKKIEFDMLHVIEWDLLLFDSLDEIYKKIPENCIGLTALTLYKNVENKWYRPFKDEWIKLLKYAKDKFGYNKQPYASLGPGFCLPKNFLEKFSEVHVPVLCNDELRLALFGQIFRHKLIDTGFYQKWFDPETEKLFNCSGKKIPLALIEKELRRKDGKRSFHPFRKRFKKTTL